MTTAITAAENSYPLEKPKKIDTYLGTDDIDTRHIDVFHHQSDRASVTKALRQVLSFRKEKYANHQISPSIEVMNQIIKPPGL